MQPRDNDASLDEITQVINKLEGKLKDDRLSEELRNSNVTISDTRFQPAVIIKQPNNYSSNQNQNIHTQPIYHQAPIQQYQQLQPSQAEDFFLNGRNSRALINQQPSVGVPLGNPYHHQQRENVQSVGSVVGVGRLAPELNEQILNRTKRVEEKLNQYERFEMSIKENNRQMQEQLSQLIDIVNFQQNQIVVLQSQNSEINHQLRQALEIQKVYEQQLRVYKLKVMSLQRMAEKGCKQLRSSNVAVDHNRSEVFSQMMKKVTKNRVGSPGKSGSPTPFSKK